MKQAIKTALLLTTIAATTVGCSGMPKMDLDLDLNLFDSGAPSAEVAAKYKDSTPDEAIAAATAALKKAKAEKLAFYSPGNYEDAKDALDEAKSLQDKKKKAKDIFTETYKVEARVAAGLKVKTVVEKELKEVLALKTSLESRKVKKSYGDDYEDLMDDVMDMISDIEKGKADGITKDRQKTTHALKELEVKVIKYNAMHEADIILQQAAELDGEKLAPKTYRMAAEAQKQADAYIQLNPYNEAGVAKEGAAYAFAAEHALHVTKEVRRLQDVDKKALEKVVLTQEERLLDISKALGAEDFRNKALPGQVQAIAAVAKGLVEKNQSLAGNVQDLGKSADELSAARKDITGLKQQVEKLKGDINTLKAENKSLTDEKIYLTSELVGLKTKLEKAETAVSALSLMKKDMPASTTEATDSGDKVPMAEPEEAGSEIPGDTSDPVPAPASMEAEAEKVEAAASADPASN